MFRLKTTWWLLMVTMTALAYSAFPSLISAVEEPGTSPTLPSVSIKSNLSDVKESPGSAEILGPAVSAEEKSFSFEYLPPLSITDCLQLLGRVIRLLNPDDPEFWEVRKDKALEIVKINKDYVKMVDETHSSLSHYRWYFIGREKVSPGGIDEDIFEIRPMLKQVSAISFTAEGANVLIHTAKAIDAKEGATVFKVTREIEANLPKREICFLYFPTDLKRIIIDYSCQGEDSARVSVYCGVSPMPEYAKASIYHLSLVQKHIREDNGELAIEELKKAWVDILKYKNSRNL